MRAEAGCDLGNEARSAAIFEGQQKILGMLARGEPSDEVLGELCRAAEAIEPTAVAAVLVLDRDNRRFDRGIAPTLGLSYTAPLAGALVGPPHVGTCAAAVFRGEPVTSKDIANDMRWNPIWRDLHLAHGIQACQSTPVFASDGRALGTFVLGFPKPSELDAWDTPTIGLLIQLAGLALERARIVDDLRELNRTLEQRVEERTRERDRIWNVSQDLLLVTDRSGIVLSSNPAWGSVLGWSQNELLGTTSSWIEHLEDRKPIPVSAASGENQSMRREIRLRHKDGSYRWFSWSAVPEYERIYHVARDVTEEKAAAEALRAAEESLRQAQKMEAVGQLTSGLAHDFNNILSTVLGNLEIVEMHLDDEALRKMVRAATNAAQRGSKLTDQLLVFARKHRLDPDTIDLASAIIGTSELLRRTLGTVTSLNTALPDGLWQVHVDATQLEMALLNLAINARDAMGIGGVVLIEARNVKASDPDKPEGLAPGDYVAIAVSDTGRGMTEEVMSHALEPFFTTKEVGKGTGLGLPQVYGFTRQSGGDIRIRSTLGQGTTVEMFLPRAPRSAGNAAKTPSVSLKRTVTAPKTVLVVDDQEDVRDVMVAYLEMLGHRAIPASSGRIALSMLNEPETSAIDLLLVDFSMPGLSGVDVAREARQLRPGLPIVLITGYADPSITDDAICGTQLLRKPCRLQDLAAAIEAACRNGDTGSRKVVSLQSRRS